MNVAYGLSATISGGNSNSTGNQFATVGGGYSNDVSASSGTISGGYDNAVGGSHGTVGGGYGNLANGPLSTIGGGESNSTGFDYSTVSGGYSNDAPAARATVSGGYNNMASSTAASVGGGEDNVCSGMDATISGGYFNQATNGFATVSGGASNIASGWASMIPGGMSNQAIGAGSFTAGRRAIATNQGCFVWGDYTDADVICGGDNGWVTRASGGYGLYTNATMTSGVSLAAGSGTWSSLSDKNLKENLQVVDSQSLLENLAKIPISTWNYISQEDAIRHIGPMAQDFYSAFGVGEDDKHITTIDADGVALAAIQGLYAENQGLKAENASLQAQYDDLEARVKAIESGQSNSGGKANISFPWMLGLGLAAVAGVWVTRREKRGGK